MKKLHLCALVGLCLFVVFSCSQEAKVVAYNEVEVKPVPVEIPAPEYPEIARKAGMRGQVVAKALIDVTGAVERAEVAESSGSEFFDEAALDAVKMAKFKPAQHQGKPVRVWVSIPITFDLRDCPTERPEEEGVVAYHLVEVKPKPIRLTTPAYPEEARKNGIEGMTVVKALVDHDGTICITQLLESSGHEILDNAALLAVQTSTFTPASHEGQPAKVWVSIPIKFKLSG